MRDEDEEALVVPQLFVRQVAATPEAPALRTDDTRLTYARLGSEVERLARVLAERGAAPGGVVAVELPRGADLVTALLAVLTSGAAYLPLDPALPPHRRNTLLTAAGAHLVIGTGPGQIPPDSAPKGTSGQEPGRDLFPRLRPDDQAYLMPTSGTTGEPKLVTVTHGALAHHARVVGARFGLTPADRVLQFAGPGFDVYAEEVYPTLLSGGTVVVPGGRMPSPAELEACVAEAGVTVLNLPTPYWDQWVLDLAAAPRPLPASLRLLVIGSDVGHTHTLASWWRQSDVPVLNAYGLTETTITALVQECPPSRLPERATLPIGVPLPGVTAHVLDDELNPVPDGTTGELYLGGALLARGYHGMPALTAERFLPDPFGGRPGARLYRTGDLVTRTDDGALVFHGRRDAQLKIRGQRVEPGEVSAALCRHPAVRQAYVRAVRDDAGDARLVGYVVADDVTGAELRTHLARLLPAAMVPDRYVPLPELPLTPGGKVDVKALESATPPPGAGTAVPVERLTGMEALVAGVWADVLRRGPIGPDDTFFELGGHSLLLVQVQRRLSAELGRTVSGVDLFAHPTVRKLAAFLADETATGTDTDTAATDTDTDTADAGTDTAGAGGGGADEDGTAGRAARRHSTIRQTAQRRTRRAGRASDGGAR
ncbi:amino acid adenylation domain-containing protein [Streptomyces sp. NPDC047928]|uniref:non-ribosomal peptide synthetase n=1 Tax=unclassified Streptomyces TaxID=2593676 RepID=UPI003717135F